MRYLNTSKGQLISKSKMGSNKKRYSSLPKTQLLAETLVQKMKVLELSFDTNRYGHFDEYALHLGDSSFRTIEMGQPFPTLEYIEGNYFLILIDLTGTLNYKIRLSGNTLYLQSAYELKKYTRLE